jgi:hypothetical protein
MTDGRGEIVDGRRAIDHLARAMIDLAGSIADPIVQPSMGRFPSRVETIG